MNATKSKRKRPEVFNNTTFTEAQLRGLPEIGRTVSKWRERNIILYAHPTDAARLISVGTTFGGEMTVIADEERLSWATALDYIAHGKVYVSE